MNKLPAVCAAFLVVAGPAPGQDRDKPEPTAAELVRALSDRDPARRAGAAWELARRGEADDDATKALEAVLADEARLVRGRAAVALWRTGKPPVKQVLPGLLAARNDPDEAVRAAADEAWAEIGPGVRAAMSFVKRSLTAGTDPQAQQKATEALAKPGLEAVPAILDALAEEPSAVTGTGTVYLNSRAVRQSYSTSPPSNRFHAAAVQALAKIGSAAVPTLDEALGDRSPAVREVAATALGRLGADARPAVPTLIGLFKDRDPSVRLRAAEAVGQLGPTLPETVPALTAALAHRDPVVRRAAATALQRLQPTPRAVAEALTQALEDPEPFVRVKAAEVLLQADPPPTAALATLVEELRGRDGGSRAAAAQLLEKMGAKARPVAAALSALTAERDRMTRVYACRALAKLGGAEAERAGEVLRELLTEESVAVRTRAAEALWDQGAAKEALPVLLAGLGTNDPIAQSTANQALQKIRTSGTHAKELVPALADALADGNPNARNQILNLLNQMGPNARPAAPAVARLLRSGDNNVQNNALNTLRSIGGVNKECVAELVEAMRSPNQYVRSQVVGLIGELGPDAKTAVPALKALLKDSDLSLRLQAFRVLHRVSPDDLKDAAPILTELFQSKDANVRTQAFYLVGELGPQALKGTMPFVLEALKSSDPQLRAMATNALSRLEAGSTPEVRAALRESLESPDANTRLQVVPLLERAGEEERKHIVPAMTELLKHEQAGVRARAAEVLYRHGEEARAAALPVLRETLKDSDPNTRLNAARVLLQSSGGPVRLPPRAAPVPTPGAARPPAAEDDQKAAVAAVADVLKAGPPNLRMNAVYALQSVTDPSVLKAAADGLKEALADPQSQARVQAAQLLTRLDGSDRETGIKALAELATDRSPQQQYVRQQAMNVLRSLGPDGEKAVVPILLEMLKDQATRLQAANELSQLNRAAAKQAVPVLKEMLADANAPIRLQAAQSLIRIGGKEETSAAATALSGLLTDASTRVAAASALLQLGPEYAKLARPVYREMLKDPNPSQRLTAAQQLVQDRGEDRTQVVPVLRDLLKDGQPQYRVQAAQLLIQVDPDKTEEAVAALRELVKDRQTRFQAISALAGAGPDHAATVGPVLREMLKDPDFSTRVQAVNAIGQYGPAAKEAIPELAELLNDRRIAGSAASALGRLGGDAVPHLLKALESGDLQVRRAAAQGLGQVGPDAAPAVPALVRMLTAEPPAYRGAVQFALQRIGPAATTELASLLTAEDPAVRRAVAEALQGLSGASRPALPALEKAAADKDQTVRWVAARAAFQAGSRSAAVVRVLADGLRSDDAAQRRETARVVSGFWPLPDAVLDGLKKALDDDDGQTRVHAAAALARSDSSAADAAPVLVAALKDPALRHMAVNGVTAPGAKPEVLKAAVPGLRVVFKDPQARQSVYLAQQAGLGLARAGAPDAVELLTEAATSTRQPYMAAPFLQALAECGAEGVAALKKLAEHDDTSVRQAALDSLGRLARKDAGLIPVLADRLKDRDMVVRLRALAALAAAGPNAESAAGAVAALLRDPTPVVRLEAAVAVAQIGASDGREEALKVLLESLNTRSAQATASTRVVEAVGRLGADAAPAVPVLVRLTEVRLPFVRAAAAEALGAIGKPAKEAVPALRDLLKTGDGHGKAHAAAALWRITGEAEPVVPALTAALDEPTLRRPVPQPPPTSYPQPPAQPGVTQTAYYYWPLTRTSPDALLAVIRTLGEIGPEAEPSAKGLRRLVKDPEPEIAKAAAEALKRIETADESK